MTARRSGGFGERIGDAPLALALDRYVSGEAATDAVAAAFLAERIVGHSPTFDPERADRQRLLELVMRCSDDPSFDETTPDALVRGLLAARAGDLKAMDAMNEQLSGTVRHLEEQVRLTLPALPDMSGVQRLLEHQERALASVSDSIAAASRFSETALAAMPKIESALLPAEVLESFSELVKPVVPPELLASLPKITIPKVPDSLLASVSAAQALPVVDYSSLFDSVISIDTSAYMAFRDALPANAVALPDRFTELFSRDTFRVSELLSTARAMTVFAEAEGAGTEAVALVEATTAAETVTGHPTTEDVLAAVHSLRERIDELELQRQRDRCTDVARDVVLFVLAAIVGYLIALHFSRLGIPPSA